MLTWDLVRAKVDRTTVTVRDLTPKTRAVATEVAEAYLERLEAGVGGAKSELKTAFAGVAVPARQRKIADGLRKLLDDRCTWAMAPGPEPAAVRSAVFQAAAKARYDLRPGDVFERDAVLAAVGDDLGLSGEEVDARLYADLKENWILEGFKPIGIDALVQAYELANRQALLLRATSVVVEARGGRAGAYRNLFRKLKFLRLLHRIREIEGGGYRIEIEGPYALFEQVTKYGVQLAMLLPTLDTIADWTLTANVLWGPQRVPRTLTLKGHGVTPAGDDRLPDDLAKLVAAFKKLKTEWVLRRSTALLHLPGAGLCVPDLVFKHPGLGTVYLELMGYWSRDAVWKRVELVEAGLPQKVVFALSSRLRVSEEALGDDVPAALYVFKGAISAKAVLAKVEEIAGR